MVHWGKAMPEHIDPWLASNDFIFSRLRPSLEFAQNTTFTAVIHIKFQDFLTHWGRDKMAAFSQTTLSNAFSWMKILKFRLKIHWSLFLRVLLTIFQHWFWWWLGADQATSHYLNQCWLDRWRIYASLGLNELTKKHDIEKRDFSWRPFLTDALYCFLHLLSCLHISWYNRKPHRTELVNRTKMQRRTNSEPCTVSRCSQKTQSRQVSRSSVPLWKMNQFYKFGTNPEWGKAQNSYLRSRRVYPTNARSSFRACISFSVIFFLKSIVTCRSCLTYLSQLDPWEQTSVPCTCNRGQPQGILARNDMWGGNV